MFVESILLPYILGIVTDKSSQVLFQKEELALIIQDIYDKSEDEFNRKYPNIYGGKFNNFLARQENKELLLKHALNYGEIGKVKTMNELSFDGNITPNEIVDEFILIFNKNLNEDSRLIEYRNVREHYLLTKEILDEIKGLKAIYIRKFEEASSMVERYISVQPFIIKKSESDIDTIINGLSEKDIIIIDSFRGFGKTETLYQTALNDKIKSAFDKVLAMKHGVRNIIDALQTEIVETQSYLIIIDDIDVCKTEFIEVLNFLKGTKATLKVIATTQTYTLNNIRDIITKLGLYKSSCFISLNKWTKPDFIELLRAAASEVAVEDEELIVAKYPSPSLISWIGRNSKNSKTETVEDLFAEYHQIMRTDTYEMLKDILDQEECDRLIFNISCLVPFKVEEDCSKFIEQLIGIKEGSIHKIMQRLETGGIMRKIGDKVRFYPDIKGDIYLAYSLKNEMFFEDVIFWLNEAQDKILYNINEARYIYEIHIDDLFKTLIKEWSLADEYFSQDSILKKAIHVVSFEPELILDLIYCYLEYAIKESGNKYLRLTTDDFGPILMLLWRYSKDKKNILEFLRICEIYQLDGVYDNYKVNGITKSFFSPINSATNDIGMALNILDDWLRSNQEKSLTISKYALSELLKGSHEVSRTIVNGIQYGQRCVLATEQIISIRQKGIELIKYLLDEKFNYESVKVIEYISNYVGAVGWGNNLGDELPLQKEIAYELDLMVDMLGSKLNSSHDIASNIVLERILIRWWAVNNQSSDKSGIYLAQFKRSPEYLFAKYYVDAEYRFISFDELQKNAPIEERWKWFIEYIMHKEDETEDNKRIAELLNDKVQSLEALYKLLLDTSVIIKQIGVSWSIPNIITHWNAINQELFTAYIQSSYYKDTYELFRGILFSVVLPNDIARSRELIEKLIGKDDAVSTEELTALLGVLTYKSLNDEFVFETIETIINISGEKHLRLIMHRLYFIFKERNKDYLVNILIRIISSFDFDTYSGDMIYFLLKHFISELRESDKFEKLKEMVLSKLTEANEFDYHENSIVELLVEKNEEALSFLTNRISVKKDIPYHGFTFLKKYIQNEDEYQNLINVIIDLAARDIITTYEAEYIYKTLFWIRSKEEKLVIVELLTKHILEDNVSIVLEILQHYRLEFETLKPFIEGIKYLNKLGMQKEAGRLLSEHNKPYGGWSRSTGSDSPEIISRIELYREIYNSLPPGKLKIVADRCIKDLESNKKRDLISDEEIYNPR